MAERKNKVAGKVVLITGASSGIGAATALAFNSKGARVAIAARRKERLDQLSGKMQDALALQVDISREEEARQMVRDTIGYFGRIDVLINNAAQIIISPADTVNSEDLISAFRTNLIGPVTATREAMIQMKKQGAGQIINVGSPGFMMGIPFYSPYVCSKAAFCAWTRTIQAEWEGNGIMVSEYFPGYILTDSKPESRIGEVEQDLLMSSDQNWLSRKFTHARTPEDVAKQLVRLVEKPKILTYSGNAVKLGALISNIPKFRLSLAKQMARSAREKKPEI
ncbi:MAG: SDR family oxidoreductase [Bacteroidales bacterium]|nr:SDR family oxidoreductase [Bacteroidales bacterium]